MGARLFDPGIATLTLLGVYQLLRSNLRGTVELLFVANLGALLIWAVIAIPLGLLLFATLQRIMRNFHKTLEPAS